MRSPPPGKWALLRAASRLNSLPYRASLQILRQTMNCFKVIHLFCTAQTMCIKGGGDFRRPFEEILLITEGALVV